MSDMFEMRTSVWALGPCVPGPLKNPRGGGPSAGVHPAAGTPAASSAGSPGRDRAPQPSDAGMEAAPASNGRSAGSVEFRPPLPGGAAVRAQSRLKCDYFHFRLL